MEFRAPGPYVLSRGDRGDRGGGYPKLAAAKWLLDLAKSQGFTFQRVAPGPDGPLFARRETTEHRDEIYLGGFGHSCHATRARKSSLIVPGALPITSRVSGDALSVLHTVVSD